MWAICTSVWPSNLFKRSIKIHLKRWNSSIAVLSVIRKREMIVCGNTQQTFIDLCSSLLFPLLEWGVVWGFPPRQQLVLGRHLLSPRIRRKQPTNEWFLLLSLNDTCSVFGCQFFVHIEYYKLCWRRNPVHRGNRSVSFVHWKAG